MGDYGHGDTAWFTEARLGMFIHWGTYALGARHEWLKNRERMTDEKYQRYFDHFDPDLYDPAEWARMAKQAGMRYVVVTAKHHEGFCLWDSAHTDYKASKTPFGRDALAPLVDAFRAEGIRIGFYYSLIDWHHPQFPVDSMHPRRDDTPYREANNDRNMAIYSEYMRNQVTELLTSFGQIDIIWFDFSYPGEDGKGRDDWESEKLVRVVRSHQPTIIIDNRLDLPGSADIITPEQYQPQAEITDEDGNPVVWEACQTLSGSWGYHRDEATWKSNGQLLGMLIDGVSKNGNLLLNVGPTSRGEFDDRAVASLDGIGKWMRRHGRSIYGCGAAPEELETPIDCRYTYNAETNRLYLHIFAWPFKSIVLPGLSSRVEYAQLLNDGSEVLYQNQDDYIEGHMQQRTPKNAISIELPVVKPNVEIPVVELFLKGR